MNSTRCVLSAALFSLLLAGSGCKKESTAGAEPAAGADPSAPKSADLPAAPGGPPPEPASANAVQPGQAAEAAAPAEVPTGDVVALGAGGKAKVLPSGGKTVADTPTYTVTLAVPASVGKG